MKKTFLITSILAASISTAHAVDYGQAKLDSNNPEKISTLFSNSIENANARLKSTSSDDSVSAGLRTDKAEILDSSVKKSTINTVEMVSQATSVCSTSAKGVVRYDYTTKQMQSCNGSSWEQQAGSSSGSGSGISGMCKHKSINGGNNYRFQIPSGMYGEEFSKSGHYSHYNYYFTYTCQTNGEWVLTRSVVDDVW